LIYDKGFPTTSYPTFGALAKAINTWHGYVTGYTVQRESKQPTSSCRGFTRMVQCKCTGKYVLKESDGSQPQQSTSKCDCPWKLWTEEFADEQGNVVCVVSCMHQAAVDYAKEQNHEYVHLCHNHAPLSTHAECMIDPGNHSIPEMVQDYTDHMNKAHMMPSKIYRNLVEEGFHRHLESVKG
jgi:hypothetical protein